MSTSICQRSGTQNPLAALKFLADLPLYDEEKPYTLYGFPLDVKPITNCEFIVQDEITITDMRDCDEPPDLEQCGFEFHNRPSSLRLDSAMFEDFEHQDHVQEYLRETIVTAVRTLHASTALCFDWRLRRTGASCDVDDQLSDLERARYRALAPASLVHCDYSYTGGFETLQQHLTPSELEDVRNGHCRVRIINAWRPLRPVKHTPLVLCDRRTVNPEDVLEVDQVSPAKVEMSMSLKFRHDQKYYWLSDQTPEEILLFTSWDSVQTEGACNHTPHGANMRNTPGGTEDPRESVEVRLIVMWPTTA